MAATKPVLLFKCPKCRIISTDAECNVKWDMRIEDVIYYDGKCPRCRYEFNMPRYKEGENDKCVS